MHGSERDAFQWHKMDDPSVPSSSNVTGRRKRAPVDDDDEDDLRMTPLRKVRGAKKARAFVVVPDSMMSEVNAHVDEIINKKKVGELNCFEYKSPLEMYGIEKMIESKASIQEMSVVLESAQIILGYRVDRLLNDVRAIDAALASGDMRRNQGGDNNDIHLSLDNRKAKKKMAITDGMTGMSDYLNQIDDADAEILRSQAQASEQAADFALEETIAGEARINPRDNSKDVDLFLQNNVSPEDLIKSLASHRAINFTGEIQSGSSALVSNDDTAHDLKDSTIDFLKCNPTFQKATKGTLDNSATSFHSLNHYGIHSTTGRALLLHPRIIDDDAVDCYFTSDLTVSLANNTRVLLENSLAKKPTVLDNYLMLEVKERPVVGRYKIMASKEVKKSILPLAEANRERDLANLTFAEMSRAQHNADTTVVAASDMSMLQGNQILPLAQGENDETILVGNGAPNLNQTISTASQGRTAKDEYVPLPFQALDLEEALVGRLPMDPMDMADLIEMYDSKLTAYNESDSFETKLWKNGLGAEEWGADDEYSMRTETRNITAAGIDGWIKATDSWTNYDVVRMSVNREARAQLDENAFEEQDSNRNMVPELGKNYFLVKTDDFLCSYPADRFHDATNNKMVGEEMDVMKIVAVGVEEDNQESMDQIRQHVEAKKAREQEEELVDDMDDEPAAYDVDFDEGLAAPADVTEEAVARVVQQRDEGAAAEILLGEPIDEQEPEQMNEAGLQREIEELALGEGEVAELMTAPPPKQMVVQSSDMKYEIRNLGKNDNGHWVDPLLADQLRLDTENAQRKRREKKGQKSRKATVEEYLHYFRDIGAEEREQDTTEARCQIAEEKAILLAPEQIYRNSLGSENKPYVALEMNSITNSGLFFNKKTEIPPSLKSQVFQNNYGKVKLERVKQMDPEGSDMFCDDSKGNSHSDCLAWLMTFRGFKCVEQPDAVTDCTATENDATAIMPEHDYINNMPFDDDYDRYNPRFAQELAAEAMGVENRKKWQMLNTGLYQLQQVLHSRDPGEYEDDDEFDDSFDRQNIQAKNLDAAKHKKCLADILNNDTLSMPCIQYALEQLTINNQTLRLNSTAAFGGPSTNDGDESLSSPIPPDPESTLHTVFDYHSPHKMTHDVNEIMKALTEQPDYVEEEGPNPNPDQPSTSEYGTRNTENRKVKIAGVHTLLSLALSMPPKMGEMVKPSSIVSFILHIANENSLKIVQDRSKRTWMSDFVVLNQSDALPSGLRMGKIDEMSEFWKKTQDPDAIEGSVIDQSPLFEKLLPRSKVIAARKGRGAAGASRPRSPADLGAIAEEDEAEEQS